MQYIKVEHVLKVYSGKDGKCCCGCAGKYSVTEEMLEAANKDAGWKAHEKANPKMVAKVVRIINEAIENNDAEFDHWAGVANISTVIGGRLYIVYIDVK